MRARTARRTPGHLRVTGVSRFRTAPKRPIIERTADKTTSVSGLRDNVAAKPGESQQPIMMAAPTTASCITKATGFAYGLIENILADPKILAAVTGNHVRVK